MSPTVSVCIPSYNGETHLAACLESVLDQTARDLEVLVVDDGSTDRTVTIASAYAERDRRIRLVENPRNLGLVHNWNRCVELASSPLVKFVFQDDLLAPTCVERMAEAATSSLVVCRREIRFEGVGRDVRRSFLGLERWDGLSTIFRGEPEIAASALIDAALDNIGLNFVGEPTATLVRTEAFERVGRFDPELVQLCDWEQWLRIGAWEGIRYVDETLATFRVHAGAATSANRAQRGYRARYLDPLRILRKIAHHPAYEPVRARAGLCPGGLDQITARYALRASVAAGRLAESRRRPDPDPVQEWESFLGADPQLADLLEAYETDRRRWLERHVWQTELPLGPLRWFAHPLARHVSRSRRALGRRVTRTRPRAH